MRAPSLWWLSSAFRTAALLLGIAGLTASGGTALAQAEFPKPSLRLVVAGGGLRDGAYQVGVEMTLPVGWHTYWRFPGDSGVPPTFDSAASGNVGGVTVSYPAPQRYFDGYGHSIIYHGRVLFPMAVVPDEADDPAVLRLTFHYGYCEKICVPGTAEFEAVLAPDDPVDPEAAAAIDDAAAAVPVTEDTAPAGAPRISALRRSGDDPRTAVAEFDVAAGPTDEVDAFVEGPDGWYLGLPEVETRQDGTTTFRLPLAGAPKQGPLAGAPLRITVVGAEVAVEAVRTLD